MDLPTLSIQSTNNWLTALPDLNHVQQALFISKASIHYFFAGLKEATLAWPKNLTITVLGEGSAKALTTLGLTAHHIPPIADSEHLLNMPHLQFIKNQSILIIKGLGGRPLIAETLTQRGAKIYTLDVYSRELPEKESNVNAVWQNDAVDIILFTSQQAMEHLFVLMGPAAQAWIQQKPCVVISPRLAKVAAELGIKTVITSRYEDLLKTLEGFKHDSSSR